jgi:2-methylcitrate dehydratase PrpD
MNITSELCSHLVGAFHSSLREDVAEEGRRAILNVLATAIGASNSDAVNILIAYAADHGGGSDTPLPGRRETADLWSAAAVIGTAAHYDDFDDTHLETIIHPGAPILATILPLGWRLNSSGNEVFQAFILGCEAELRVGAAMSPSHYDLGWHITGTCGALGAAVAAGLLLGLDESGLERSLGFASTQTLGLQQAFGTMAKPLHAGKAAVNGIQSALLARQGATAPLSVLERADGLFDTMATTVNPSRVVDGFGSHWELLANTYKPFPCGIVSHPAIEAALELNRKITSWHEVQSVTVYCHPLVVELTGNPAPKNGLEARFSATHGVAAALLYGVVGVAQYTDVVVCDPDVARMRSKTTLEVDPGLGRDAAIVDIERTDGSRLTHTVTHAAGSRLRPLTNDQLLRKAISLIAPVLGDSATLRVKSAVDELPDAADLRGLLSTTVSQAYEGCSVE